MLTTLVILLAGCEPSSTPAEGRSVQAVYNNGHPSYVTLAAGANLLDNTQVSVFAGSARLTPDASGSSLAGLTTGHPLIDPNTNGVACCDGEQLEVFNNDPSNPITILNTSTAAGADDSNWIATATGHDEIVLPGQTVRLALVEPEFINDVMIYHGWREVVDLSVHGVMVESTPSRSIGTAWMPNAARPTLVIASMSATCVSSGDGGQAGHIDIAVGPINPPTRVIGSVLCANLGPLVNGATCAGCDDANVSVQASGGTVTYLVKPGDYVEAIATGTVGAPSYTLTVTEETL